MIYPWSMNKHHKTCLVPTYSGCHLAKFSLEKPASCWNLSGHHPTKKRWNHQSGHFYRHINHQTKRKSSTNKLPFWAEWDQDLRSRDLWLETCQLLYCLKTACLDIFSILVLNFSGLTLYLHSLVLSNSNGISPPYLMFCYYINKNCLKYIVISYTHIYVISLWNSLNHIETYGDELRPSTSIIASGELTLGSEATMEYHQTYGFYAV